MRNSKSQTTETQSKPRMKHGWNTESDPCLIRVSSVADCFGFRISDFGFRISNLEPSIRFSSSGVRASEKSESTNQGGFHPSILQSGQFERTSSGAGVL